MIIEGSQASWLATFSSIASWIEWEGGHGVKSYIDQMVTIIIISDKILTWKIYVVDPISCGSIVTARRGSSWASICFSCPRLVFLIGKHIAQIQGKEYNYWQVLQYMWPKCLKNKKRRVIEVPFSLTSCCTWSSFLALIYSIRGKGDSGMMPDDPWYF